MSSWAQIRELRRRRRRSWLLLISIAVLASGVGLAVLFEGFDFGDLLRSSRLESAGQFISEDLVPFDLRGESITLGALWEWAGERWRDRGAESTANTLAIAVLALVLASFAASVLAPLAARNLARAEPFATLDHRFESSRDRWSWRLVSGAARTVFVLARAIPEFLWAFLLVGVIGPTAWPAILALFLHNAGSLGRLGADTIENLPPGTPRALRDLGARRGDLVVHAVLPLGFNRFFSYFCYRLETGIREATVLGMLGIASLGYWIEEARARRFYDEMFFLVSLAVILVLAADLVSVLARAKVGRSQA